MQRNQKGFTLIELVIVIVILGILSAFALPRFADLGSDARAASIEGAAGAIKSASSIVRSACLVADSGTCDESVADDTIDLEGTTINVTYGYPTDSESAADEGDWGIIEAAQIDTEDFDVTGDAPVTVATDGGTTCQVQYTAPTDANEGTTIDVDVSGC